MSASWLLLLQDHVAIRHPLDRQQLTVTDVGLPGIMQHTVQRALTVFMWSAQVSTCSEQQLLGSKPDVRCEATCSCCATACRPDERQNAALSKG